MKMNFKEMNFKDLRSLWLNENLGQALNHSFSSIHDHLHRSFSSICSKPYGVITFWASTPRFLAASWGLFKAGLYENFMNS